MGRGANDGVTPSDLGESQSNQPDVGSRYGGPGIVQDDNLGQNLSTQGQLSAEQQTPQREPFLGMKPEDVPDELKPMYKEWQANYTRLRQAETESARQLQAESQLYKQKAEQLDVLTNDPGFQQWLVSRQQQNQQQQSAQMPDMAFVDEYEDAPVIKGLVESIMQGVNNTIKPLQQEMASIKSGMSRQQADAEFSALVQRAKENNWTDPSLIKRNMDFLSQQYPTLPLMHIYSIAERQYLDGGKLISKPLATVRQNNQPPVMQEQSNRIPVVGETGSVTQPPGGATAVTGNTGRSLTALDQALKQRQENKGAPVRLDVAKLVAETVDGMRARGEKIDPRDL
jgi:hypothetical protein